MKKTTLLFFLFTYSSLCLSQTKLLPKPEAHFSAIIVSNIEASINWYTTNFGFKVLNKIVSKKRGFKQANLKSGSILIELIELNNSLSQTEILKNYPNKTKIEGFFKFGFLVSEFEKWVTHLKHLKVEFYGTVVRDPVSKKKTVLILDPDGNRIQLFEK